jgi:hypothetical protein
MATKKLKFAARTPGLTFLASGSDIEGLGRIGEDGTR